MNRKIIINYRCYGVPSLDVPDLRKGDTFTVACDEHGTPLSPYWRMRFRDALTDGCLTFVDEPVKKHTKRKNENE